MGIYVYLLIFNLKVWKTFQRMVQNPEAMQEVSDIFDTKINLYIKYLAKTNPEQYLI